MPHTKKKKDSTAFRAEHLFLCAHLDKSMKGHTNTDKHRCFNAAHHMIFKRPLYS